MRSIVQVAHRNVQKCGSSYNLLLILLSLSFLSSFLLSGLQIDPAMRGWLRDARSYLPPVQIGEVMRAGGVGTVVKSNSKNLKEGDRVSATVGWQQYVVLKDGSYSKLSDKGDSLDHLGVFGSSGQTAYCECLCNREVETERERGGYKEIELENSLALKI